MRVCQPASLPAKAGGRLRRFHPRRSRRWHGAVPNQSVKSFSSHAWYISRSSALAFRKRSEHLKHPGKGLKPHFAIPYHRHVETIAGLQHPIRIAKIQPMLLQTGLAFLLIPTYASCHQTYCSNIKNGGQWRRRTFYADKVSLATGRNAIVRLGSEGGTD